MAPKSDLLQGTLDLLILRTLATGGHAWMGHLASASSRLSDDVLQINQGSLYPALHRLEQQGLIEAEWGNSENNRQAKFYQLTREGRKQLAEETRNWERSRCRGPGSGRLAKSMQEIAAKRPHRTCCRKVSGRPREVAPHALPQGKREPPEMTAPHVLTQGKQEIAAKRPHREV